MIDDVRELVRRGVLLCFGMAASTMACLWSLSYGYNYIWNYYNVIASIFPLIYAVLSTVSVIDFMVSKNTRRFITFQLIFLSFFPIMVCVEFSCTKNVDRASLSGYLQSVR